MPKLQCIDSRNLGLIFSSRNVGFRMPGEVLTSFFAFYSPTAFPAKHILFDISFCILALILVH